MSKPQITIHIDGPAGSGKSTLAEHFATYLKTVHGMDVTLIDDGHQRVVPRVHNPLRSINASVEFIVEQK